MATKPTMPKKTAASQESKPVEATPPVAEAAASEAVTSSPAKASAKAAVTAEIPIFLPDEPSAKKTRAKAPAKAEAPAEAPASEPEAAAEPDQAAIYRMIQEAAYYLAEKRNFAPGFEQEDWETAKAQVMERLGKGDA
jgi:hypothetical protein